MNRQDEDVLAKVLSRANLDTKDEVFIYILKTLIDDSRDESELLRRVFMEVDLKWKDAIWDKMEKQLQVVDRTWGDR